MHSIADRICPPMRHVSHFLDKVELDIRLNVWFGTPESAARAHIEELSHDESIEAFLRDIEVRRLRDGSVALIVKGEAPKSLVDLKPDRIDLVVNGERHELRWDHAASSSAASKSVGMLISRSAAMQ